MIQGFEDDSHLAQAWDDYCEMEAKGPIEIVIGKKSNSKLTYEYLSQIYGEKIPKCVCGHDYEIHTSWGDCCYQVYPTEKRVPCHCRSFVPSE